MKYALVLALALGFSIQGLSQQAPLRLVQSIPLPGIKGRFDHLAVDLKNKRLFLAARENQTIEVIDLASEKRIRSIRGIGTPHAEWYVPETNELLVAIGDRGLCTFLDGSTFKVIKNVKISVGADSIVYDPGAKRLYIVNGGKDVNNYKYSLI
ncbi:MAG: YncE family protein, partial [Terriglobia bacterium]